MHLTYGAYGGSTTDGKHARSAYTGACLESGTGAYALGRRLYSPLLRRFLNPDPVSPFGTGGLNRYAYCSGDPVNRIDPGGKTWQGWMVSITGLNVPRVRTDGAGVGLPHGKVASTTMNETMSPALLASAASGVTDTIAPLVSLGSIGTRVPNPKAGGDFGWASLGSGPAPGGLTSLDKVPLGTVSTEERAGYRRTTHTFSGNDHQIDNFEGPEALLEQVPSRMDTRSGVTAQWHSIHTDNRGVNYVTDTEIDLWDLFPLMDSIGQSADARPIVILAGAHGANDGVNWANGRRLYADRYFYDYARAIQPTYATNAQRRMDQVEVRNIGDMSNVDFLRASNSNAIIVHAYCYGIADRELMFEHNIARSTTYRC
jgi:RHS repeat-associated protein